MVTLTQLQLSYLIDNVSSPMFIVESTNMEGVVCITTMDSKFLLNQKGHAYVIESGVNNADLQTR